MKIYLDDDPIYRKPPDESWVRAYDYWEALGMILDCEEDGIEITEMSLDHDLGPDFKEKTGYCLLKWIRDTNRWPTKALHIHTANPVASIAMIKVLLFDPNPYNRREGRSFYV